MRRTVVTLVLALTMFGGAAMRMPTHAATLPVIASGGGPTHGWVAIEWSHRGGAQGVLTVTNNSVTGAGFVTAYLYDATNRALGGASVGILGNQGDVHVQANVAPVPAADQTVVTTRSVPYGGVVNITFDSASLPPGTYKALFIAGGNGRGWSWSLNGNAAVSRPTATTSGSDVYAYSAKDFAGPVSTQAYAGSLNVASTGAAVNVGTTRSITAAHALVGIGFFAPSTVAKVDMTMAGPTGARSCTCTLPAFAGPDAAGPGTWRFTYTGAGAGPSNMADVLLGVADAQLP